MTTKHPWKLTIDGDVHDTHDGDKYATTKRSVGGAGSTALMTASVEFPFSFGRYEILEMLGEGAMGSVYLARDTRLDRKVAVKIPKLDDNSDRVERFKREAQAMATTHHANLCPVYDVDEYDGMHFLTMAFIEGKTLTQFLVEAGVLSQPRVAALVQKLALAVHAAHQANVIHRDLKPANIIINNDNQPVIMDFGLARLSDEDSGLTEDGLMLGTPAYMSPEQVKGRREDVGPTSDIYSLGAMMYEMLTGRLPFDGTIGVILEKIVTQRPVPMSQIVPNIDPRLEAICLRALEKEPRARFSSAKEFAESLREFLVATEGVEDVDESTHSAKSHHQSLVDLINRVRSMWTRGEYSAALPVLEAIAGVEDPEAAKYSEWARQELPKVRQALVSSSTETIPDIDVWDEDFGATPMGIPTAFRNIPEKEEPMPGWVLWLIPIPAIVILLLAIVFISSNPSKPPADETNSTADATDDKDEKEVATNNEPADDKNETNQTNLVPEPVESVELDQTADEPMEPVQDPPSVEPSPSDPTNSVAEPEPSPAIPSASETEPMPDPETVSTPSGVSPSPPEPPRPDRPGPESGGPHGGPPPPPRNADEVLQHHDKNGDDILTEAEIPSKHRHHLMRADKNNDKKLTKAELTVFFKNFKPPPHPPKRPK